MDISSHESLRNALTECCEAIDACVTKQLKRPALILTYCTIDIVSSLYSEKQSVQARFTEWVDKYLLPRSSLKCTAIDLYGARCGMVHSNSPASYLSKAGKAVEAGYAWLPTSASSLEDLVGLGVQFGLDRFIAIQADDLILSLRNGIQRFLDDLLTDVLLAERVYVKASTCFGFVSTERAAEMRERAENILRHTQQDHSKPRKK